MLDHAIATQRHLVVAELNMNPTVSGEVVDPFDDAGIATVEFSVLTQVMVSPTAEKS
jgi:hypothetical protein